MKRYSRTQRKKTGRIKRQEQWDISLIDYLKSCKGRSFEWGKFDCITFANNAVKCQLGYGFADELLGKHDDLKSALKEYRKWQRKTGFNSVFEGLDAKFERVEGFPPRGSIVAMPVDNMEVFDHAFGIQISHLAAFVTAEGLLMIEPKSNFIAWRVE